MQDHYEILQVHPNADQESIQAAYERMRARYDASRLEHAAEELVELARSKRDDIERAYAVLGDPVRRATYDEERRTLVADADELVAPGRELTDDDLIDYHPLPPAKGQERPEAFDAQPSLTRQRVLRQSGRRAKVSRPSWVIPVVIVGATTFVVLLVSLLLAAPGNTPSVAGETGGSAAQEVGQANDQLVNSFESQIEEARVVARQAPESVNAWINLGNILYDSVQVVREHMPGSPLYQERLPRWLEAGDAYREALNLDPENVVVRADLAASLCKYGEGTQDQAYVEEGLVEARRAVEQDGQNARARLNLGICLINTNPPQTEAALEQWRAVLGLSTATEGEIFEAQQLITTYNEEGTNS